VPFFLLKILNGNQTEFKYTIGLISFYPQSSVIVKYSFEKIFVSTTSWFNVNEVNENIKGNNSAISLIQIFSEEAIKALQKYITSGRRKVRCVIQSIGGKREKPISSMIDNDKSPGYRNGIH
jgi:hypothetical protein